MRTVDVEKSYNKDLGKGNSRAIKGWPNGLEIICKTTGLNVGVRIKVVFHDRMFPDPRILRKFPTKSSNKIIKVFFLERKGNCSPKKSLAFLSLSFCLSW